MATVSFANTTLYPHYSLNVDYSKVGYEIVNINKTSKGGSFSVSIKGSDNENVKEINSNYLKIEEGSSIVYGWVEDWTRERNGMFTVNYKIDAFRTFRGRIRFGEQYVSRVEGYAEPRKDIKDPLIKRTGLAKQVISPIVLAPFVGNILGDTEGWGNTSLMRTIETRYLVVQVRPRSYVGGIDIADPVEPSNNPLNPSQYRLYIAQYSTNNPNNSVPIRTLLEELRNMSETSNIVTMYSVPFVNHFSELNEEPLILRVNDKPEITVDGFKVIDKYGDVMYYQRYNEIVEVSFDALNGDTAQLVSPEGQVLEIPPSSIEFKAHPKAYSDFPPNLEDGDVDYGVGVVPIERIVDLYSGIVTTHIGRGFLTPNSIRTGPLGDITILSDPKETYKAQNKNAISVGLLNDAVAVGGILAAPITGGMSLAATTGALGNKAQELASSGASMMDAGNSFSNSPMFMGETITPLYNNVFHIIVNEYEKGYGGRAIGEPLEKMVNMDNFPWGDSQGGYIQTNNCAIESGAPGWAIDEINGLFNSGISFKV